jgi:hypothetical protein
MEAEFIEPADTLPLLRLGGERFDIVNASMPILDRLRQDGSASATALRSAVGYVAQWIERDLSLEARPRRGRDFVDWADSVGLGAVPSVERVRTMVEYAAPPAAREGRPEFTMEASVERPEDLPVGVGAEGISHALDELLSRYATDDEIAAFIAEAGRSVAPTERKDFLEALVELPIENRAVRWHPEAVIRGLGRLLAEWRTSGLVRHWTEERLPLLVERNLPNLLAYDHTAAQNLRGLLGLPIATNTTALLLRAVANHVDELRAPQILAIAEATSTTLDGGDLLAFAECWSVSRLEREIPVPPQPALPAEADAVLAAFVFAIFGNVDKRKRWRAAHATRRIIDNGRQSLVGSLVSKLTAVEGGAFVASKYPFFWLSARQWLTLLFARIADDHPETLRPHFAAIRDTAIDPDLPHSAIRAMAKRAALSLVSDNRELGATLDTTALAIANELRACLAERKFRFGEALADGKGKKLRFRFDELDTLPYWYSSLGRVFGVTGRFIARRAEPWIVDYLGYGDDDVWTDERELSREGDYGLVRNDHGTIPVLETLRTYLEYHGMLLASGEMVDEGMPVAYDEWEAAPGPWQEWLGSHVEDSDHWWLSDLRSTAPLEPLVYGALEGAMYGKRCRIVTSTNSSRSNSREPSGSRLSLHSGCGHQIATNTSPSVPPW